MRQVRVEQNADRVALQQRIRKLEEMVQAKQLEIQATNTRTHGQLQQLQVQLNDEIMKARKMREENAAMQMQRQQLELRMAQTQEVNLIATY